jgi:hypothetical protein
VLASCNGNAAGGDDGAHNGYQRTPSADYCRALQGSQHAGIERLQHSKRIVR